MHAALIALCATVLGALIALGGAALADRRQSHNEARRWRRDQLSSAYDQCLRHLLRAANRRSEFAEGNGGAILRQEHQREWFDDLIEAQASIRRVAQFCDPNQSESLTKVAEHLDAHVARLVSGERFDQKDFSIWLVLITCIEQVTKCSRRDHMLGGTSPRHPWADEPFNPNQVADDARTEAHDGVVQIVMEHRGGHSVLGVTDGRAHGPEEQP